MYLCAHLSSAAAVAVSLMTTADHVQHILPWLLVLQSVLFSSPASLTCSIRDLPNLYLFWLMLPSGITG
jgi:hypothetical protein